MWFEADESPNVKKGTQIIWPRTLCREQLINHIISWSEWLSNIFVWLCHDLFLIAGSKSIEHIMSSPWMVPNAWIIFMSMTSEQRPNFNCYSKNKLWHPIKNRIYASDIMNVYLLKKIVFKISNEHGFLTFN